MRSPPPPTTPSASSPTCSSNARRASPSPSTGGRPPREDDAIGAIDRIARRHGLAVYATKMAREMRPPVPADKGTAVEGIVDGTKRACFAGDDRGDLDAFAALERLSSAGRLEHAVRIAVGSAEVPPELLARADLVVDGPPGLVSVLEQLAAAATRTPR